jgi:hypothetical protein
MKTISKKIWPEYFEQVRSGAKPFEIRLNDENDEVGNTLRLQEWFPNKCPKCNGDGFVNGDYCESGRYNHIDCLNCNGTGKMWQYTDREVVCWITSIVHLSVRDYPLNGNAKCGFFSVLLDGKEFWKPEEIGQYGLVVLGLHTKPEEKLELLNQGC